MSWNKSSKYRKKNCASS